MNGFKEIFFELIKYCRNNSINDHFLSILFTKFCTAINDGKTNELFKCLYTKTNLPIHSTALTKENSTIWRFKKNIKMIILQSIIAIMGIIMNL